ncbi:hybrid sensor histidine kinase/response regulator transcription factor [Plebeiibacterium marinum]|uniref:histidine kinase n=1 Tax=Plebeiibacterium marinum TaxID=2992111 RepID=A0AAE3MCL1_9BACT|nr:hybrid sensor histidine kinase/response regulator transcription factor [Plebeiobacterium marinum]MCW3805346.1 response regulator [Plebeiobacterium marinum]
MPNLLADNAGSSLYFTNLRQEEGLPSNVTNSIVQDNMGFIWIGTGNGLCRYDGYNTLIFQNDGTQHSIPTNNTSCLMLEGDTLWVGTWEGLSYINTKNFEVKRLNLGATNSIRCLYKTKDNKIWIGTSKGLLRYDKALNKFEYFDTQNSNISHATIRCFYETPDSTLWIGTYDKLNSYKAGEFASYNLKGDYKPFLKNNLILDISSYQNKNDSLLIIGTETGLSLFNIKTKKSTLYNIANTGMSNEVIKCIENVEGNIWLGTDFGMSVFNLNTKHIDNYFHNPIINHSIANNVIWNIFTDRDGVLWLLTSNGISMHHKENSLFTLHEEFYTIDNQLAGNQIRDIHVAKNGTLYLATIHGIIAKNPISGAKTNFTANAKGNYRILLDNTYAVAEDPYGRIWIGSAGGINIWDPSTHTMHSVSSNQENGLTSNYISSFAFTPNGTLWVSAWEGGIYKLSNSGKSLSKLRFIKVDDASPDRIYACGEDIYYSTQGQLHKIDHNNLTSSPVLQVNKELNNQKLKCFNVSKDGAIWIITEKGILKYIPRDQSLQPYPLNNPVINNPMSIEVIENNIWMSSRNAIIQYNIHDNSIASMPLNPNYPLKNFYAGCCAVFENKRVYFGGDNGYIEASVVSEPFQPVIPRAVISGISINNKLIDHKSLKNYLMQDIAYTPSIDLNYTNNSLSFHLSSLNYWLPEKSYFRYRLQNFDDTWYNTHDVNFITYSNLNPGEYVLEFEAINYLGIKSDQTASLQIKILPPLLLSKPFIALYIFALLALIYLIFRIYTKRQKLNNQLRLAHLEKNHSEELLNAKQQFFTNISHEFRTPLSLITPPIQQVLNSGVLQGKNLEMLKLAEKNSKRLLKLVNQILDFRKLENQTIPLFRTNTDLVLLCSEVYDSFKDMASRNEVNYLFNSNNNHFFSALDKEKIEAVLYNLLSNAFKYTPSGGVIKMEVTTPSSTMNQEIKVSISDSGAGIGTNDLEKIFDRFYQSGKQNLKHGTGIGLAMAQQYALLHQGNISVNSQLGQGSIFTLTFPAVQEENILTETQQPKANTKTESPIDNISNPQQKHLLIIDDNPDILDYVEMNLQTEFNISKATNGETGYELAQKEKPDIIVSDIMMPVMDGIEMCTKIKHNETLQRIPVILLTAKSLDVQKTEGIQSGANMYITKPFDINYLKACIYNLLNSEEQLYNYIRKELLVAPKEPTDQKNNQDEQFIKRVMEIISENISNPELSVDMISAQMGMSSTHLYRKTKAITNQSTKDILKNYRLQKAAQMIKNKEGNITEIMYHVGFNSLSSFSKSFKAVFGVSPSEYGKEG